MTNELQANTVAQKLDTLMAALLSGSQDATGTQQLAHAFCKEVHKEKYGDLIDPFSHHYIYKPGEPGHGPYGLGFSRIYDNGYQSYLLTVSYPLPDSAFQGLAFVVNRQENGNKIVWYKNSWGREMPGASVIVINNGNKIVRWQDDEKIIIGWMEKKAFEHMSFYRLVKHTPGKIATDKLYEWENVLLDCSVNVLGNGDLEVSTHYTVSASDEICNRLGISPGVVLIEKKGNEVYRYTKDGDRISYRLDGKPLLSASDLQFLKNIQEKEYSYDLIDYIDFVKKYKHELEKLAAKGSSDQQAVAKYFLEGL